MEELSREHESRMTQISRADREAQRNRRMQRALEAGTVFREIDEEQLTVDDAEAFTREDGGSMTAGMGVVSDGITLRSLLEREKLIEFRWRSFTPQSADKLVKLDIDKIEDLFEPAGIRLTDLEATNCLLSLKESQLGRHSLQDVLAWYEEKHFTEMVHGVPRVSDPAPRQYTVLGQKLKGGLEHCFSTLKRFANILEKQRNISDEIALLNERKINNKYLLKLESPMENSLFNSVPLLALWQHRRKADDLCKLVFNIEFGKDVELAEEAEAPVVMVSTTKKKSKLAGKPGKPASKSELAEEGTKDSKISALKNAMKNIADGSSEWNFQIQIDVQGGPSHTFSSDSGNETGLLDAHGCLRMHPALFSYADVADHFKIPVEEYDETVGTAKAKVQENECTNSGEKSKGTNELRPSSEKKNEKDKKKKEDFVQCKTVLWISLMCEKGMPYEQAEITRETLHRTFEGIPYDYRCNFYRYTKSKVFHLPPEEARRGPDYLGEKCIPPISNYSFVVVLALLHENDIYLSIETMFARSNVAVTRALRNFSFSLKVRQSLSEVITASREYDNYESRLFGPQEEEIGEEGMNPIRFAKACRRRRQDLENAAEAAKNMTVGELKEILVEMGLNDSGTRDILLERAERAYKHKLSLVGSGELSEFGKVIVGRIFDRFDEDQDGSLSLWEMNKLLYSVKSATLPNEKEYRRIMDSNDFHGNENGYLTKLGLCAYYERYGRLSDDISALGLGSLADILQGEMDINILYDPDAIVSLKPLLERHTLTQRFYKKILSAFCSLKSMTWDAKVDELSDVFAVFRDLGLHDYIQVSFIHYTCLSS